MNKYMEILLGLVLVALGAYGIYKCLPEVTIFIKGVIGIVVLFVGIIVLAIGVLELKE